MPIDAAIPLQAKGFQGMNPQEVLSLQHLSQTMQMQDEQISEYKRKRDSENALRTLFSEPDAIDPATKQPTLATLQKTMAIDPAVGLKMRGDMITAQEKLAQTEKAVAQTRAALATVDQKDRGIIEKIQLGAHNLYEAKLAETKDAGQATAAAQEFITARLGEEDKLGVLNKKYIEQAQPFNPERSAIMVKAMRAPHEAAPTELKKLMDERNALPANDPRRKEYDDKIKKLGAPTSTMINMEIDSSPDAVDTRRFAAEQYLAGDKSVLTGLGRSPRELLAMRKEITKVAREKGMTPEHVAVKIAEFEGLKAGERTAGTREAQLGFAAHELEAFIPLAEQAIDAVPRVAWKPINKLIELDANQRSPEQAALVAANRAVINAFSMVASRGAQTVHNVEEAEKMLSTAGSQAVYKATLKQLSKEVEGALKAPKQVRADLADRTAPGDNPQARRSTDKISPEDQALIDKYK